MSAATAPGSDGRQRCRWCLASAEYTAYHDAEWGFPVGDDQRLFEKLCLEGFQAGLSWRTILAKRERFRTVFRQFDIERVARFTGRDVDRLITDPGIVRHRGKIEAAVNNARRARELIQREGSLGAFLWRYEPEAQPRVLGSAVSVSAESIALSKDLKRLGWRFVGPTTMYAFMQAMGLINDHAEACVIRAQAERARAKFRRPGATGTARVRAARARP